MTEGILRLLAMLDSARELTLDAAASASSAASARLTDLYTSPADIARMLSSLSPRDQLAGLKSVAAIVGRGGDALALFPHVVKNISSPQLPIRRLVYAYLLRHAESHPDLALLAINSIQRSLSDRSATARALAIRVLAGIRLPAIAPIAALGVQKCARDPAPDVRRAAAIAARKVWDLGATRGQREALCETLVALACDADAAVAAAAVVALQAAVPENLALFHPAFRPLCAIVGATPLKVDEWAAAAVVDALTRYTRAFLAPADPDCARFVSALSRLCYLQSPAVLLAAARAYVAVAPDAIASVVPAVVRLAGSRGERETQRLALETLLHIDPEHLAAYFRRFFVLPHEPPAISRLKLLNLGRVATAANAGAIVSELRRCVSGSAALGGEGLAVARAAVGCLATVATRVAVPSLLGWLLEQVRAGRGVATECLALVHLLLQQEPARRRRVAARLLELVVANAALSEAPKASLVWLLGECLTDCVDAVRVLARSFKREPPQVRYQTVLLAAKVYCQEAAAHVAAHGAASFASHSSRARDLYAHVMVLARYDTEDDTRDRARMLGVLLTEEHLPLAVLFLQAPKPAPVFASLAPRAGAVEAYFLNLPAWTDAPLGRVLRDATPAAPAVAAIAGTRSRGPSPPAAAAPRSAQRVVQSLDDFFADDGPAPVFGADSQSDAATDESESSEEEESEGEESEGEESEGEESESGEDDEGEKAFFLK